MNTSSQEIKKLHVEAMGMFAVNNIPHVDETTLKQFLELVNCNGSFGSISHQQIVKKMNHMIKYIPGACANSLLIMLDLLEIDSQGQCFAAQNETQIGSVPAFAIESLQAVALGRDGFYVG